MSWFKPRGLLDRTFEITIIAKGLDGLLELIGGLLLLLVTLDVLGYVGPSSSIRRSTHQCHLRRHGLHFTIVSSEGVA